MPRYFFNVVDGAGSAQDPEGTDLPDLAAARAEAIASAKEIVANALISGGSANGRRFEVADEAGNTVFVLRFAEAIA